MPGMTMHAKSDSDVTSYDQSTPPRSPRRPIYYVQSPSNNDVEKMSYGSSPLGSPHHYYHCSPIHHSRESSTSRFSSSLKNPRSIASWKKLQREDDDEGEDDDEDDHGNGLAALMAGPCRNAKLFCCFVLLFFVLLGLFSLILWGASKSYEPKVIVESMVFRSFEMQAGNDRTGVPTDMLSLNSTVRILYKNPGTFFGVHVTSTPLELHCFRLKIASGQMKKFYQERKSHRRVVTIVLGHQVPLYGGLTVIGGPKVKHENVVVPLNLTFTIRSRAHILGNLVRSKFYSRIRCFVTLRSNKLDKLNNLTNLCTYN